MKFSEIVDHLSERGFVTRKSWNRLGYIAYGMDNSLFLTKADFDEVDYLYSPSLADMKADDWVIVTLYWNGSQDNRAPFQEIPEREKIASLELEVSILRTEQDKLKQVLKKYSDQIDPVRQIIQKWAAGDVWGSHQEFTREDWRDEVMAGDTNLGYWDQATEYHDYCMERVRTTPPPKDQKFLPGTRVWIKNDLGCSKSHFPSGVKATVLHTDAHALGSAMRPMEYCLDVDEIGSVAWYEESDLELT